MQMHYAITQMKILLTHFDISWDTNLIFHIFLKQQTNRKQTLLSVHRSLRNIQHTSLLSQKYIMGILGAHTNPFEVMSGTTSGIIYFENNYFLCCLISNSYKKIYILMIVRIYFNVWQISKYKVPIHV